MALKIYPNGLKLSITNRQQKLASVVLMITSGTQSEKNYEAGISEFVSRMLLMGTSEYDSRAALSEYARNNGVILSSDNTSENIVVCAQTTADKVPFAIELLSKIAFESTFTSQSGDIVRNSMLADIYKLQENPSYNLDRMVNQALFYRTGLANPKFGTVTTISRMTAAASRDFLKRILTPKNTVISVVGDVDADAVYDKVMKTFYSRFIDGGDYKKLKFVAPIEDFIGGQRTKNKKLNQSRMFISFPSLSYKSTSKWAQKIIEPLMLRRIRLGLGQVQYFHSEVMSSAMYANNGKLTIEAMVDYEHVNDYLKELIDALKQLKETKLTEDEFETEKQAFVVKFLESNDSSLDLALNSAKEASVLKQSYSISSELMKIDLLKVQDANKVVDQILNFGKIYVAYLGAPVDFDIAAMIR